MCRKSRYKVSDIQYYKLLNNLPFVCQSCSYNCNCDKSKSLTDIDSCDLYDMAYDLQEIHNIVKEHNINLYSFCKDYGLKYKYLMKMLKGQILFNLKYYQCIVDRITEKNEFAKYEERFILQSEVALSN